MLESARERWEPAWVASWMLDTQVFRTSTSGAFLAPLLAAKGGAEFGNALHSIDS